MAAALRPSPHSCSFGPSLATFTYLPEWQVLLCALCGYCLVPTSSAWARHLRAAPHRLRGPELASLLELFASYALRPLPVRHGSQPALPLPARTIPGLQVHDGFACLLCPTFLSCNRQGLQRHLSKQHRQKRAVEQVEGTSYRRCALQTFFAEKRHIEYFVVDTDNNGSHSDLGCSNLPHGDQAFMEATLQAQSKAQASAMAQAKVVAAFDTHRSEVIPWLQTTGIAEHICGLCKDEIASAIALPTSAEHEPALINLLAALDQVLREAHHWCFDGPDRRLTWPRQLALNRFQNSAQASGRQVRGFNPHKEAATLTVYFGYWKQFLCYHYRVVYRGGHFTKNGNGALRTPDESIHVSLTQQ